MKKTRIWSFLLVLLMTASLIPFHVFTAGADGADVRGSETVTVESQAGVNETITVESETTEADGKTVTARSASDVETESGMIASYDSTDTVDALGQYQFEDHYTSHDAQNMYEAEGSSEKSNEFIPPKSEVDIKITDKDGENASSVVGPATGVIESGGDPKESEDDGVYDYWTKTRLTQSKIDVVTKSFEITDAHGAVNPDDMEFFHTDIVASDDLDLLTKERNASTPVTPLHRPPTDEEVAQIKDGYQYVNLESDQHAAYWPAWLYSSPMVTNETPVYDDGTFQFYKGSGTFRTHLNRTVFYLPDRSIVNVADVNAAYAGGIATRWDNVCFYTLTDRNKDLISVYCADQRTNSSEGFSYNISNLEDAEYYTEEQAKHIRAICNNGYFGAESGSGSLDNLKQQMQASGKFEQDAIDLLTPGMAMCAMQMAIWSYSNVIKDNMTFLNVHHVNFYASISANTASAGPADPAVADLIMKLYWFLQDLEPEAIPEDDMTTENTIINEKNFLKSASLTITGKPEDHANNQDADKTNDVYTVDLSFALKVKPSDANGDDLVLNIFDQDDNLIVAGRIAGALQTGEVQATVSGDGEYTLSGIELQEGETALKFALSGAQNLKNDVYFFTSENRDGVTSQSMVGIASGKRDVNIWTDIKFRLDVTDEEIEEEHVKRTERDLKNETVDVEGKKTWVDNNDHDKLRPTKITVLLLADGEEIDSVTVAEKDGWKWSWKDLPKYKDGKEIVYTVKEKRVSGYIASVEGCDITNSYAPPTDDPTQPILWIALLALSMLAGVALLITERMYAKKHN